MKTTRISILVVAVFLLVPFSACAQKKQTKKPTTEVKNDTVAVLTQKATAGDAIAQNTLGTWYYAGKNVQQDYSAALKWWSKSADQGNTDAIANMAMCYQLGWGAKQDSVMAINLYKAAVRKGNKVVVSQHEAIVKNTGSTFSSMLLYDLYMNGIGVKQDKAKAATYLENVAKAGNADCQYRLALYYLNNKQADLAAKWFKAASDQGVTGATYYYGYLLHQGTGIAQDKPTGIAMMQQASSKGFPAADYQLGKIYYEGNGVTQDYKKAVEYLKKAVATNADSRWLLGLCYLKGQGVEQDYYRATQWLGEAGNSHVKEFNALLKEDNEGQFSQYLLGLKEYYVNKNYDQALDCFKKVSKAKVAEGETMTGIVLANKNYDKRNLKKAIKVLEKASAKSPVANYYLSSMYESGTGVNQDKKKALELLEKASDAGIAYAQCKLGDKYMTGDGVPQDYVKAAQLYLQAEVQKHLTPESAKNLAVCYEKQVGCLPDLNNAKKRIESLNSIKQNDRLMTVLKAIEK